MNFINLNEQKLFLVEFNEPSMGIMLGGLPAGGTKPVFVLAETYDSAAEKGLNYAKERCNTDIEENGIVNGMGDLKKTTQPEDIKVFSVKIVTEEVVY